MGAQAISAGLSDYAMINERDNGLPYVYFGNNPQLQSQNVRYIANDFGSFSTIDYKCNTPQTKEIKTKGPTMFGTVKKYFEEHRDLIMSISVILLLDWLVFDGAFRDKLKVLMDRLINNAEHKFGKLEKK